MSELPRWLPAAIEAVRGGATFAAAAQAAGVKLDTMYKTGQRRPEVRALLDDARRVGLVAKRTARAPRPAPADAIAVAEGMSMAAWLKLSDAEQARVLAGYAPAAQDDAARAARLRRLKMQEAQLKLGKLRFGGEL